MQIEINMNERDGAVAKDKDGPLFKFRTFDSSVDLDPDRQGRLASLLRDSVIHWQRLDTLTLSLLTKAPAWSYEEEYRVVLPRGGVVEPLQIVPHNGKGLIFGGGMSEKYRTQNVQLARKYERNIQFFKAGIHRRKYEVAITELTANEIDTYLAADVDPLGETTG